MSDLEDLTKLEHDRLEAVQRKDYALVERIVASDYSYTATGHGRWSRQRWIDNVPDYDIRRFEFTDFDVRVYGDVAVVLARLRMAASLIGEIRHGEFLITDVWARNDSSWQVVARSSILVPESSWPHEDGS